MQVIDLLLDGTNGLCLRQLLTGDADTIDSIHTTSCLHLTARNGHLNIVRCVRMCWIFLCNSHCYDS